MSFNEYFSQRLNRVANKLGEQIEWQGQRFNVGIETTPYDFSELQGASITVISLPVDIADKPKTGDTVIMAGKTYHVAASPQQEHGLWLVPLK